MHLLSTIDTTGAPLDRELRYVQILELQPAGKKRMTAEEFLRGYPLKEGDRFGPEPMG